MSEPKYAGFWIRTWAAIIDSILMIAIILPVMTLIYGTQYWTSDSLAPFGFWDVILNYIVPAIAIMLFWIYRSATPGKMVTKIKIVDAQTGAKPTTAQFIKRYFGYYLAMFPLFIGIFWVAFDKRKQGWQDKFARTVVVYAETPAPESSEKVMIEKAL